MYFKPSITSIKIPFTHSYIIFFTQENVTKRIEGTLNLLTLDYTFNNNEIHIEKFDVNLVLKESGKFTLLTFNVNVSDRREKYIRRLLLKSLCTIPR